MMQDLFGLQSCLVLHGFLLRAFHCLALSRMFFSRGCSCRLWSMTSLLSNFGSVPDNNGLAGRITCCCQKEKLDQSSHPMVSARRLVPPAWSCPWLGTRSTLLLASGGPPGASRGVVPNLRSGKAQEERGTSTMRLPQTQNYIDDAVARKHSKR